MVRILAHLVCRFQLGCLEAAAPQPIVDGHFCRKRLGLGLGWWRAWRPGVCHGAPSCALVFEFSGPVRRFLTVGPSFASHITLRLAARRRPHAEPPPEQRRCYTKRDRSSRTVETRHRATEAGPWRQGEVWRGHKRSRWGQVNLSSPAPAVGTLLSLIRRSARRASAAAPPHAVPCTRTRPPSSACSCSSQSTRSGEAFHSQMSMIYVSPRNVTPLLPTNINTSANLGASPRLSIT